MPEDSSDKPAELIPLEYRAPSATPSRARCRSCGVESPLRKLFYWRRTRFNTGWDFFCPACIQKERDFFALLPLGLALFILILLGPFWYRYLITSNHPSHWDGSFLANCCMLVIFLHLSIIPHELGHAAGALLVRMEVWCICFGRGFLLGKWHIGGIAIELRSIPRVGSVQGATLEIPCLRWRALVKTAAGPLANLALAFALVTIAGGLNRLNNFEVLHETSPFLAFALANVIVMMHSLFGNSLRTADGLVLSDGRQILALLFSPLLPPQTQRLQYYQQRAQRLIFDHSNPAALEVVRKGLAEFPSDPTLKLQLPIAQMCARDYEGSRTSLAALLLEFTEQDLTRAGLTNSLAWADLILDHPEFLNEADAASAEAYLLLPWNAAIQSTRGSVLIERGNLPAGIKLLEQSLRGVQSYADQAAVLCGLAVAESRLGNPAMAKSHLSKAQRLDPNCELLPRARGEVLKNA
ncbi:MAG: hypothetical protein M3O30_18445 [Planctomycetota bacterium]|nr:hypothetical protein [Planctomycetota bacterium]